MTLEKITEFVFVNFFIIIDSSLKSVTLVPVVLLSCAWNAVMTTECRQNIYAFYNTGTLCDDQAKTRASSFSYSRWRVY